MSVSSAEAAPRTHLLPLWCAIVRGTRRTLDQTACPRPDALSTRSSARI